MENIRKNIEQNFVDYFWDDMQLNTIAFAGRNTRQIIQSGTWDIVLPIVSRTVNGIRWNMSNLIKK